MPAVHENLRESLRAVKPIGLPIPDFERPELGQPTLFELLAEKSECTVVETGSPIGGRIASLAIEAGITQALDTFVLAYTHSDEGEDRMRKFIRHHVVRRAPIVPGSGQEGPKLTGHETLLIAQSYFGTYFDNPHAIALVIALEGAALQKGRTDQIPELLRLIKSPEPKRPHRIRTTSNPPYDPEPLKRFIVRLIERDDDPTISRLQSRGFQQMPLNELRTINNHLAAILAAEQAQMGQSILPTDDAPIPYTATDFRERILNDIKALPIELQRIYYYLRDGGVRILYAVPKLQEQTAALHAPDITQVGRLAHQLDLPLQQEHLGILYELMKMVSRGIEPVTRKILEHNQ